MHSKAVWLLLALCLTGCGEGNFVANATTPPNPAAFYHAYGDSITFGFTLSDRGRQAYPALFAAANGITVSNNALSGDLACDVPARQIFPAADNPSTAKPHLYSLLISTNDVDTHGTGPSEAVFNLCHQASIAWLAVPAEFKVLATAAAVTTTGATHLEPMWNARTTDALNATITFSFQQAANAAVYIWYRITDRSTGTFSYTLDGKAVGTGHSNAPPYIETANGTLATLALLRLPPIAPGAHTLIFTQTSTEPSGVGIVAIGAPPPAGTPGLSRVLVGTTPLQANLPASGLGVCALSAAPCLLYIADITANIALLASDGLNVQLWDARKYMTATSADMNDSLHPNELGNQELAHALQDAYK